MTNTIFLVNGLPQCEGWLEKYSVGRSVLSRKCWRRRYVLLGREGVGYMQKAPQRHISSSFPFAKPSSARCFVPFESPRKDCVDVKLRPVYFLRRVTPLMHTEVPNTDEETSLCSMQTDGKYDEYYYFALSFKEGSRRLFLLFRTADENDYNAWSLTFSLYVSAGSIKTIIPMPHPLESLNSDGGSTLYARLKSLLWQHTDAVDEALFHVYINDPNPCNALDFIKIYRQVLDWDEGEIERWLGLRNMVMSTSETVLFQEQSEDTLFKLVNVTGELEGLCDDENSITALSLLENDC